jgi:hypothetical protein
MVGFAHQRRRQFFHVGRQRRARFRLEAARMDQFQPAAQRLRYERACRRRDVDRVADHRVADVLQVDADLVGTAGLQPAFQQGITRTGRRSESFEHAVIGARLLAALRHRHARAHARVAADRGVDLASRRRHAVHQREVGAFNAAIGKLRSGFACAPVLRHHHEAAGVLVEPVQMPARGTRRSEGACASSAFISVRSGLPAPGCTISPAGLFSTTGPSSYTIASRMRCAGGEEVSAAGGGASSTFSPPMVFVPRSARSPSMRTRPAFNHACRRLREYSGNILASDRSIRSPASASGTTAAV